MGTNFDPASRANQQVNQTNPRIADATVLDKESSKRAAGSAKIQPGIWNEKIQNDLDRLAEDIVAVRDATTGNQQKVANESFLRDRAQLYKDVERYQIPSFDDDQRDKKNSPVLSVLAGVMAGAEASNNRVAKLIIKDVVNVRKANKSRSDVTYNHRTTAGKELGRAFKILTGDIYAALHAKKMPLAAAGQDLFNEVDSFSRKLKNDELHLSESDKLYLKAAIDGITKEGMALSPKEGASNLMNHLKSVLAGGDHTSIGKLIWLEDAYPSYDRDLSNAVRKLPEYDQFIKEAAEACFIDEFGLQRNVSEALSQSLGQLYEPDIQEDLLRAVENCARDKKMIIPSNEINRLHSNIISGNGSDYFGP